jgi:hypothetical protein
MVWHTSRQYSVSCWVLSSISLVTHSAALTILSCNSFKFVLIHDNVLHKPPEKKRSEGFKSGEWRSQWIGPLLPIQWSGKSLSRKAWTRWEKWNTAPGNWKNVPTGTRCKAVFPIIVRKVSLVIHLGPFVLQIWLLWIFVGVCSWKSATMQPSFSHPNRYLTSAVNKI